MPDQNEITDIEETFWRVTGRMGFCLIPEDQPLGGFWRINGREEYSPATGDAAEIRALARAILKHVPAPDPDNLEAI